MTTGSHNRLWRGCSLWVSETDEVDSLWNQRSWDSRPLTRTGHFWVTNIFLWQIVEKCDQIYTEHKRQVWLFPFRCSLHHNFFHDGGYWGECRHFETWLIITLYQCNYSSFFLTSFSMVYFCYPFTWNLFVSLCLVCLLYIWVLIFKI